MADFICSKASHLCFKWPWQSLWRSLFLVTFRPLPSKIAVTEQTLSLQTLCSRRSLFSKASGLYCKLKWRSLCWSLFWYSFRPLQWMTMTKFFVDSVTESVFSLKLWQSLFLVKFQAFTINGNDRICDGVYFIKVSGLYYEWQWPIFLRIVWQNLSLV